MSEQSAMSGGSHYLNPDGGRWCGDCGYVIGGNTWNARCEPDAPCWCCLAAEVKVLRAQVAELKQQAHLSVSHALAEERAEKAETQVAAVRRLCHLSDTLRATDVLDALDGGSDEQR